MYGERATLFAPAYPLARRAVFTKAVNHQSFSDYPRPAGEKGKPAAQGIRMQTH
jgi:hypothetical protein